MFYVALGMIGLIGFFAGLYGVIPWWASWVMIAIGLIMQSALSCTGSTP